MNNICGQLIYDYQQIFEVCANPKSSSSTVAALIPYFFGCSYLEMRLHDMQHFFLLQTFVVFCSYRQIWYVVSTRVDT